MAVTVKVNGKKETLEGRGDMPLLYVLRNELGLRGPEVRLRPFAVRRLFGAPLTARRSVLARSCRSSAFANTENHHARGLAGLPPYPEKSGKKGKAAAKNELSPLQQAWIDEQVPQCGYCQNGMLIPGHPPAFEEPEAQRGTRSASGRWKATLPLRHLQRHHPRGPAGRQGDRMSTVGLRTTEATSRHAIPRPRQRLHLPQRGS